MSICEIKESKIPNENIVIIEHSLSLSNHLKKRFPTVDVIHDEHAVSRLHPDVKQADIVISIGMLAHIQSLSNHLKYLHAILPENALIRFFDYSKFYKVLSNNIPEVDELKKVFRDNGFSVRVEEIKGVFWNYLIIEGVKTDLDTVYI